MTSQKLDDIKNAQIPVTTATLIAVLLFVINGALWVGSKQTTIERDILDNQRAIKQLIEYNNVQDSKIEANQKKVAQFYTAIELIKNQLNTICNDIKEIKIKER